MTKLKKMRNNASSVLNEKEMIKILINTNSDGMDDSKELISKHSGMRKSFLRHSKSSNEISDTETRLKNDDAEFNTKAGSSGFSQEQKNAIIDNRFTTSPEVIKIFTRLNFPLRYPSRLETEESESFVSNDDANDKSLPIPLTDSKISKSFIKFWNKIISKQESATQSILNHQLTDKEAGYFPCQMKTLFNSPESYLKKSFCHRLRFNGPGSQILPRKNQFCKISQRNLLRSEVNQIFLHYSNLNNQYFLIPIEFTSKLSRTMLKSVEICQNTTGCNRINFYCSPQNMTDQTTHPLLSIEYKNTIEEEVLPSINLSLCDNYPKKEMLETEQVSNNLFKSLVNYPYLSHYLNRNDFNIDNFFARCWHYSRFFCNKLDLGSRTGNILSISMKDAIFKFLLASSARICIAIKYWILNPEHATYFRCWCGQRIHDVKQETRLLRKFPIGSADLYNYQQKIQEQNTFHNKHDNQKSNLHICACNQQFKDHKSWLSHVLCTKLSDMSKICPIVLFNISKSSQEQNRFVCECSDAFSDYDFWSFWLHICNCKTFRKVVRKRCHCSEKNIERKSLSSKTRNSRKRKRSLKNRETNENGKKAMKMSYNDEDANSDNDDREFSSSHMNRTKRTDKSIAITERDQSEEREWQSGDNINLPLKLSNQIN